VSAVAGSIAVYAGFYLVVGLIFVVVRLALGPGQYGAVAEGLAGALFIIPLGIAVAFMTLRPPGPDSVHSAVVGLLGLLIVIVGLWVVWISLYTLWSAKRPFIAVEQEGVRFKSAFFRLIPWQDIERVGMTVSMWQEIGPLLFLAKGRGVRTAFWPFPVRRFGLTAQHDPRSAQEIADLIRSHPNYRGEARTS
jgi:hypothetical protein